MLCGYFLSAICPLKMLNSKVTGMRILDVLNSVLLFRVISEYIANVEWAMCCSNKAPKYSPRLLSQSCSLGKWFREHESS